MTDAEARIQLHLLLTAQLAALEALRRLGPGWSPLEFTAIVGVIEATRSALTQITGGGLTVKLEAPNRRTKA